VTDGLLSIWAPLSPTDYLQRTNTALPFPLGDHNGQLFVRARHALHAGVTALGLEPGDQVLMPAYHHGSEVEALRRAGIECVFYGATKDLEPDLDELEEIAGPRCRALYLIHVMGFPRDAARWRRWCDEQGLLLIEDAAQAWLSTVDSRPVGQSADLSIFCLYKMLPLPYVSASYTRTPPVRRGGPRVDDRRRLLALHAAWASGKLPMTRLLDDRLSEHGSGQGQFSIERSSSLGDPTARPGAGSTFLLPRMAWEHVAQVRRENYRLLAEQLADEVPAPFDHLLEGASPFAFPIEVPDKAAVIRRLVDRGVQPVDFWSTPHPAVPPAAAASAADRRARTVALPVHHRLSASDLDRIVSAVSPDRRSETPLQLERVADLDQLRPEWTDLAIRTRNVFASWEWNRLWWEHFGKGRKLTAFALRDASGTLRGILPLYLWAERPMKVGRFLGHHAGDQLGPICAPGDQPAVARAIRSLLQKRAWDVVVGEQLPAASVWSRRLPGRVVNREGSPIVCLRESWEETTGSWSRRLRKELRQDDRRIRDEHEVRITTVTEQDDLDEALDGFFQLHLARWPDGTRFSRQHSFHREFARCALDHGWLRLRHLVVDGESAAARYGFRYGTVESGYQSGWASQFGRYSVGILMVSDTIQQAQADGMKEYRFLRGSEPYKYRFASIDPGLETVVFSAGGVAGAAAAAAPALRAVRSRLRKGVDR